MSRLVFYWYWPACNTYVEAAPHPEAYVDNMDDVWRLKFPRNSGLLATVVVE